MLIRQVGAMTLHIDASTIQRVLDLTRNDPQQVLVGIYDSMLDDGNWNVGRLKVIAIVTRLVCAQHRWRTVHILWAVARFVLMRLRYKSPV